MNVKDKKTLQIRTEQDVVKARQEVRAWANSLSFSLVEQTKLVTAASELARNTLSHGDGGTMLIEMVLERNRQGLRLTFEDKGPGIPDLAQALKDGYTTGKGLGLGLGGAKRLSNEFYITSKVNEGTSVSIVRWK